MNRYHTVFTERAKVIQPAPAKDTSEVTTGEIKHKKLHSPPEGTEKYNFHSDQDGVFAFLCCFCGSLYFGKEIHFDAVLAKWQLPLGETIHSYKYQSSGISH